VKLSKCVEEGVRPKEDQVVEIYLECRDGNGNPSAVWKESVVVAVDVGGFWAEPYRGFPVWVEYGWPVWRWPREAPGPLPVKTMLDTS